MVSHYLQDKKIDMNQKTRDNSFGNIMIFVYYWRNKNMPCVFIYFNMKGKRKTEHKKTGSLSGSAKKRTR